MGNDSNLRQKLLELIEGNDGDIVTRARRQKLLELIDGIDYFDEWEYFQDPDSGIGIVVNHFRDENFPTLNVYVVPKDKVANNDWLNDMEILEMSDAWKSQPRKKVN